jgi:hypothetical protein
VNPSPGAPSAAQKRSYARPHTREARGRGRGNPDVTRRRALAALDRWRERHLGPRSPADPLDVLAGYTDWIRAEVQLIRRVMGPADLTEVNGKVRSMALQIDREIRERLGEAS